MWRSTPRSTGHVLRLAPTGPTPSTIRRCACGSDEWRPTSNGRCAQRAPWAGWPAQLNLRVASELGDIIGAPSLLPYEADGAVDDGDVERAHRFAQPTITYGGSVEVFRQMIARHDLGLPRPHYPGSKEVVNPRRLEANSLRARQPRSRPVLLTFADATGPDLTDADRGKALAHASGWRMVRGQVVAMRKSSPLDGLRPSLRPAKYRSPSEVPETCRTVLNPASDAMPSISSGV